MNVRIVRSSMRTPLTLVDARYQQNNSRAPVRLAQQCRYIGRSGKLPLFDRLLAPHGVAAAQSLIAPHALAPGWEGPVAYHRLILSLRVGVGFDDIATMRALTLVALEDLALLLDRRPVWVAGVHADTHNRHAHALVAGGDEKGRSVEIRGRALTNWKRQVEERARQIAQVVQVAPVTQ